ncbi:ATP-binding protein [Lamprobacter modestohalophilus]|uniref:RNA-binding domain-containing protein n=1 Tax=Lamprobacter modestohalophilus TaxID=1064514 RepID=UPI002ADEC93E|nr:RNA-binding domain-containing protein [Lamprobacter modestohalophilus]MEA1048440.1 ATP-binding protein [Lamprobacter modestohalophilus]
MTRSELLELIANGENSGVEFKRDDVRPEQLAKEVVALANFQGGVILLGVEDDGSISGIQRENLEEWVMDTVFGRYVHPMILPFFETIRVDDRHRVAVIALTQGVAKPYVVRHQAREEIFVRAGSVSRKASREQQARLFALGGMLHAELLPVSGTGFEALDQERLHDYLAHVLADPDVPADTAAWVRRLAALGFMVDVEGAGTVCTIAGLVLFGRRPRRALRQAGVRWMAFHECDMSYAAADDAVLDEPLVGLWRSAGGSRAFERGGLLESLLERMRPFVSEEAADLSDGVRRDRQWHYPVPALREALVNALAHRDWTRIEDVEVVRYNDRLEVKSPGALQNSMTVEKMLAGQRSPRNPLIVDVLRDYGYVDARGMGVRTKIVPLLQAHNGLRPEFEATDDYLRVRMFRAKPPPSVSTGAERT